MIDVYVGLGSNLSEPKRQIEAALEALSSLHGISIIKCSSLYVSKPMGPQNQPDYVNAVLLLCCELPALELLNALQQIELNQGRERKNNRWGPRTLDLDILLYGTQVINLSNLIIPHYGMKDREFVLYPLWEISAELVLPSGEKLSNLVKSCPKNSLEKIPNSVPLLEI